MRPCCPESRGCNAADGDEACALDLIVASAADLEEAAAALSRWRVFQRACEHPRNDNERRFRRRAYGRARDEALIALALQQTAGDGVAVHDLRGRTAHAG